MKHNLVNFNHLPPLKYRAGFLIILKCLSMAVFLSFSAFSSAQTITFTGSSGAYYCDGSGNYPEMTMTSPTPIVGSAIYWEWWNGSAWVGTGGSGYVEYVTSMGNYRAMYRHGGGGPYLPSNTLTAILRYPLDLTPSSATNFVPGISSLTLTPGPNTYTLGTWYRNDRVEYAITGTVGAFTVKKGGVHKLVATDAYCGVQEDSYTVNYECDEATLNSAYSFDITTLNGTTTVSSSATYNTHMVVDGDITITGLGTNIDWNNWNGVSYLPITAFVKSGASIFVDNKAYLFMNNVTIYSCDTWDGIVVNDLAFLDFWACNMNNAEVGIFSKNNASVRAFDDCEFEDNGMHMVVLDCFSPQISTIYNGHLKSLISTSQNNSDYAALLSSGDMLTSPMVFIKNSEYTHMLEVDFDQRDDNDADAIVYSGIEMLDVQNTNYEYCHFMDNLAYGAYLRDCSNMLIKKNRAGSHIVNVSTPQYNPAVPYTNTGMKMDQCFDIFMERSTIESCDTGLMFFQNLDTTGASISILDSVSFQYCPYGIILAPEMNPWLNPNPGTNTQATAGYEINMRLQCNQFFGAEYAVSGSGILLEQGTSSVGASNNFNTSDNPNLEWGVYWRSTNGGNAFNYHFLSTSGTYYDPENGNQANPGLDGQSITPPEFYPDPLTGGGKSNKCNPSWSIYKRGPLGVEENIYFQEVVIYPTPFQNQLHLTNESHAIIKFEIYNMLGELIEKGSLETGTTILSTNVWKSGPYVIKLYDSFLVNRSIKKLIKL